VGYEIIFAVVLFQYNRQENETGLRYSQYKKNIIINKNNKTEFYRVNKKEIVYKGILYDVIGESEQEGNLIFQCIMDADEQNIISSFVKIHSNNKDRDDQSPVNKFVNKNILKLLLFYHSNDFTANFSSENSRDLFIHSYLQPDIRLSAPPPRIIPFLT